MAEALVLQQQQPQRLPPHRRSASQPAAPRETKDAGVTSPAAPGHAMASSQRQVPLQATSLPFRNITSLEHRITSLLKLSFVSPADSACAQYAGVT